MPAPTPVDAQARNDAPTAAPETAAPTTSPARRRWVVGAVVALLALVGAVGLPQVIAADAAATAAEQRSARADLGRDVEAVRTALADPARDGQQATTALLRQQLLVVAGETPSADVTDGLVDQVRLAADELAEAATTPLPDRPSVLPVATVEPVFARLAGLEGQAADLAVRYAAAADDAEAWLAAVRDLDEAAHSYAATTDDLPSTDDPDALASAWGAEHERLSGYAEAIERAEEHEASAPLAEAHALLVAGMRDLADEAVELLDDGDVDGYNALLADQLAGDDPFGFTSALAEARSEVAEAAIDGPLEDARARGLGLLTELEELRRAAPVQLAELP